MPGKEVTIKNISCQHCVNTIENELRELEGITYIKADLETKKLQVEWQPPLSWSDINDLLLEINYPPSD